MAAEAVMNLWRSGWGRTVGRVRAVLLSCRHLVGCRFGYSELDAARVPALGFTWPGRGPSAYLGLIVTVTR